MAAPRPMAVPTGAAEWLSLAAMPSFALMALLTGAAGGGVPDVICSAMPGAAPLNGMALMYGLMSLFHAGPWFRLFAGRGG